VRRQSKTNPAHVESQDETHQGKKEDAERLCRRVEFELRQSAKGQRIYFEGKSLRAYAMTDASRSARTIEILGKKFGPRFVDITEETTRLWSVRYYHVRTSKRLLAACMARTSSGAGIKNEIVQRRFFSHSIVLHYFRLPSRTFRAQLRRSSASTFSRSFPRR